MTNQNINLPPPERQVEIKAFDAGFLAGCSFGMDSATPISERFIPSSPDRDQALNNYLEASK